MTFVKPQAPAKLRINEDVEQQIQANIAANGIRIEEFFIDFDKLRKGTCGEAAVSNACVLTVSSELASTLSGSTLRLLR